MLCVAYCVFVFSSFIIVFLSFFFTIKKELKSFVISVLFIILYLKIFSFSNLKKLITIIIIIFYRELSSSDNSKNPSITCPFIIFFHIFFLPFTWSYIIILQKFTCFKEKLQFYLLFFLISSSYFQIWQYF